MVVSPLAALIKEAQQLFYDTHGIELSYGDIARRSRGRLTRTRVQQIANAPIKELPGPERIRGLALGLGVPETVVTQRAMASAGYLVPEDWHAHGELRQVNYAAGASLELTAGPPPRHPDAPSEADREMAAVEEDMAARLRRQATAGRRRSGPEEPE